MPKQQCAICDGVHGFKCVFMMWVIYVMFLYKYKTCSKGWCDLLHLQLRAAIQAMRQITADHAGDAAAQNKSFEDVIRL